MLPAIESVSPSAMVVPAAFGASAPAAGVSPAEFAAVFRHYSAGNVDLPLGEDAIRVAHLNMGLRVSNASGVPGTRSWLAV